MLIHLSPVRVESDTCTSRLICNSKIIWIPVEHVASGPIIELKNGDSQHIVIGVVRVRPCFTHDHMQILRAGCLRMMARDTGGVKERD